MNPISQKNIILGVTGSIAAYKAAEIASKLTQAGAIVNTILTENAQKFISPLTFQSVTSQKAYTEADLWGNEGHVTHISLGRKADLIVIAPISATTLSKLAYGNGDNLLSVTVLASHCPLLVAPAMDAGMFSHPATQMNVNILQQRGVVIVGPESGHLASGLVGVGRMSDPEMIIGNIRQLLGKSGPLFQKKIVVTAGGTQEFIDPVRVITNRSSGKQGYEIAQAAIDVGAEVILISAPTHLKTPVGVQKIGVRSTKEMLTAVMEHIDCADALIMAAAPADFSPVQISASKIKKDSGFKEIKLESTPDILSLVTQNKKQKGYPKFVIGFAAESQELIENAQQKLTRKNLDMIVANDITESGAGFEVDTNRVTLIFSDGKLTPLPSMQKNEVAAILIQQLCKWLS